MSGATALRQQVRAGECIGSILNAKSYYTLQKEISCNRPQGFLGEANPAAFRPTGYNRYQPADRSVRRQSTLRQAMTA